MTPLRILLACAVAAPLLVSACSDDGDVATSVTTEPNRVTVDTSTSTSTSTPPTDATTAPEPSTSVTAPPASGSLSVAVYWTRPYGTARPIDIPGYTDPAGGPYPFVLFGAATNTGAAPIDDPVVAVEWVLDGRTVHTGTARLVDPQGTELASLAAGSTADLVAVVDDEAAATDLPDAVPSFTLVER